MFNKLCEYGWVECCNHCELMTLLEKCEKEGIVWFGEQLPTDIDEVFDFLVYPITIYYDHEDDTITYSDSYNEDLL